MSGELRGRKSFQIQGDKHQITHRTIRPSDDNGKRGRCSADVSCRSFSEGGNLGEVGSNAPPIGAYSCDVQG